MSRTGNVLRNFKFAIINYGIQNIMRFIIRTAIIYLLGKEYLGLNGLFTNILGVLNLAELGIGGAIVYSMYKPIAENNIEEVKALNNLYKKIYYLISAVILVVGLAIMPFLDTLVNADSTFGVNYHALYLIYLLNTVISFFAGHKRSLLVAYQRRDIEYKVQSVISIVSNIVQCGILFIFRNYYLYVITMPLFTLIDIILIIRVSHKYFPQITGKSSKLNPSVKKEIAKNVGAMSFHKIGDVLVNSTDNIIMSAFLGIAVVGIYSNYLLIITTITSLLLLFINSLQGSVGNLVATADVEYVYKKYKDFSFIFAWIGGFCSICMLCLFQDFILIWTNDSTYLVDFLSVFLCCLNFYLTTNRYVSNLFKNAKGLMWKDRWKPLIQGLTNIVVSIILVKYIGLAGILIGTVVSSIIVPFWIEPYVVHKHYFKKSIGRYFLRVGLYMLITILVGSITFALTSLIDGVNIASFLLKGIICFVVVNGAFVACYSWLPEFKNTIKTAKSILFKRKKQNDENCLKEEYNTEE